MRKLPGSSRSAGGSSRPRTLSFVLLGQAAIVLRDHWRSLPARDRDRLAELLKASRGRPVNLTPQQRSELGEIVRRANLTGLGRDLAPLASRRSTYRRGPLRRR